MRESMVVGILAASLLIPVGWVFAQTSVTLPPPAPPVTAPLPVGLGRPNPFPNTVPPTSTPPFQANFVNPFNNPHPMLPWGDGQIGGERYGQVIRYWEQQPQRVYNVILIVVAEEEAAPEAQPDAKPQGEGAAPPQNEPAAPRQGALDARSGTSRQPQSVVVPASWIVETTRGYLHMPRWALQEVGGGRYQWVLVGAWFHPR
jgi:hypothetical protein